MEEGGLKSEKLPYILQWKFLYLCVCTLHLILLSRTQSQMLLLWFRWMTCIFHTRDKHYQIPFAGKVQRLLTPAMVHTLPNRSALCLVNEKKWVSRLPDYTEIFPPRLGRCPTVNAPTPSQEQRPLFDTALFANAITGNVLCDAETKPFLKERPRPPVRSLEDILSSDSSETPAPALYSLGIFRYQSRSDVLADCLIRHLKPEPGEVGQAMFGGCPITVRLADCTKLRYLKKELTELGFTVSILNL